MNIEDLKEKPAVSPFSNGSEASSWESRNCGRCRNCHPESGMMTYDELAAEIEAGNHCELEMHFGYGCLAGEFSKRAALQMGWTEEGGMPSKCLKFVPRRRDDGWGDPPPPPKIPIAPNQLVLFAMDEYSMPQQMPALAL